jgi:tetratricopeptide (TPR) repeat protein
MALDPDLAEVHLSAAMITFFFDWDWDGAEQAFARSITLDPNNAEALSYYAMFLGFMGRFDEAARRNKEALALDPLSPLINMNVGWNYFAAGDSSAAAQLANKLIEMEPDFYGAYWLKGVIDLSEGNFDSAVDHLSRAVTLGGHQIVVADLASACSLAGKDEEASRILDQLLVRRREYVPAICLARVYSRIGERAKAIEWIEKAFEERNGEMVFLKAEIDGAAEGDVLRTLANDPRLVDVFRKMKLPEQANHH